MASSPRPLKRKNDAAQQMSSKRARVTTDSIQVGGAHDNSSPSIDDDTTIYNPDSKYFLNDGDIILKVAETLFKVHREKLRSLGGVFEHLFELPQPESGETIGSVPFCDLFDLATEKELRFLLEFAYENL